MTALKKHPLYFDLRLTNSSSPSAVMVNLDILASKHLTDVSMRSFQQDNRIIMKSEEFATDLTSFHALFSKC